MSRYFIRSASFSHCQGNHVSATNVSNLLCVSKITGNTFFHSRIPSNAEFHTEDALFASRIDFITFFTGETFFGIAVTTDITVIWSEFNGDTFSIDGSEVRDTFGTSRTIRFFQA